MKIKAKNKENNLIREIAHSGAVVLAGKNCSSRNLMVALELPHCLKAQLRASAKQRSALQFPGQLFSGCIGCWAAAQELMGDLPSLPGCLEYLCHEKSARGVDPSSVG